jgi:hypothetical protein
MLGALIARLRTDITIPIEQFGASVFPQSVVSEGK